jgi:hypothetical protein
MFGSGRQSLGPGNTRDVQQFAIEEISAFEALEVPI